MGLILRSLVTCLFVTYAHGLEFRFPNESKPCIIAQMNVTFTLSYKKEMSNLLEPQLETSKSTCGNGSTATLALKWNSTNDTMTFTFIKGVEKVEMRLVYGFTPYNHFKDSKDHNLIEMDGPAEELSMSNMSYKCDSPQKFQFSKDMYQLVMSVAKVQVQAFEVENGSFSNYEECSEDTLTTENPPPETTTHHSQTTSGPQTTINPPSEYTYKYAVNGSVCIMLKSAIQLSINYMDENNATVAAKVNIPSNLEAKVTGQCAVNDTGIAFIILNWKFKMSSHFSLKMDFEADEEAKLNKMEVNGVMSQADFPGLPDKSKNVTSSGNVVSFESSKLTYYKCNSPQEVKLDNITMVVIDKIQVQAFGIEKSGFTGNGTECVQDLSTENPTTVTMPTHTTENMTTASTHTNATMTTSNGTTATSAPISTTAVIPNPTNKYSVGDGNVTCVYFVARMDFTFPYTTKNGTNTSVVISVPQNFEVNGTCSTPNDTTNELNIYFYNYSWKLAFVFGPDNSSSQLGDMQFKTYSVKSISLDYKMDPTLFPGYNDTKMGHAQANITETLFQSKVNGSYKCNADFAVSFSGNIKLETYNLQYKAFNKDNSTNFGGDLSECSADKSNDNKTNSVVPIAVGAALAGLVVIVLIAYLIGRRRNRKGYESV